MPLSPPSGAALYKLVLVKPADDLSLAPDEDFGERVFWFDPDPFGHSPGLREVYPQPSPVEVGKVVAALIEQTEVPARDVHGYTRRDRLNLVKRAEKIRAEALIRSQGMERWEAEYRAESGGLLSKAQRASLLHGDLSAISGIMQAAWVIDQAPVVTGQDDGANVEQDGRDVVNLHAKSSASTTEDAGADLSEAV